MAETYDTMVPYLLPAYDYLQNESIHLTDIVSKENPIVVDIGAGSGHFLRKVLEKNPTAICYWIDYSDDFLRIAEERLSAFRTRVRFIKAAFEDDWITLVDDSPDFIFSMSAIHHLTNEEKKRLYSYCHKHLSDGGWFLNIDEMKSIDSIAYLNSLRHWVSHVKRSESRVPLEILPKYEKWRFHFDQWEERNVSNFDLPKQKGDDLHEDFLTQIAWLKEIGFMDVDLFLKHHLWCVIGGKKYAQPIRLDNVASRRA